MQCTLFCPLPICVMVIQAQAKCFYFPERHIFQSVYTVIALIKSKNIDILTFVQRKKSKAINTHTETHTHMQHTLKIDDDTKLDGERM